jgi:hypothetical protein
MMGTASMAARGWRFGVRWTTVSSLGKWAGRWDELVDCAAVPSPFLRSWWLAGVATPAAEFVLFLDSGELIGGLALERQHHIPGVPVYRFLGSGQLCPDHVDLLAGRGNEDAVCAALHDWWERPGPRVLNADGVVERSLLERTFGPGTTALTGVAPWGPLPSDPADYLSARSANLRKTLRQTQRRLTDQGIRHKRVELRDLPAALDDFVELHRRRGDRQALLAEMPRLAQAIAGGVAAGEMEVDVMESGGGTVAMLISFWHAGAVRAYQSARLLDPRVSDSGTVLLYEVVRRAIERGGRELDLLRGAEPYKFRYVEHTRQLKTLQVANGTAGAAALVAMRAGTRLRASAGRVWRSQRATGLAGRTRWRTAA